MILNKFYSKELWEKIVPISSLNCLLLCLSPRVFQIFFYYVSSNKNVVNNPIVNTVTCNFVSFATCHSRLGHPSVDAIKIVFQLCNVPNNNKNPTNFCSQCCIGKSHCLHSFSSNIDYDKPFDLVFTNL